MKIILDTNIFVAAGFNKHSSSRKIINDIKKGEHKLIWNEDTKKETKHVIEKIPPLKWESFEKLFKKENEHKKSADPNDFKMIEDPDDRVFAALAKESNSTIITNDDHLLGKRSQLQIKIKTPSEFVRGK